MITDQKRLDVANDSLDHPYQFVAVLIGGLLLYPAAVLIGSWASSGPAPGWVVFYYVATPFIAVVTNTSKALVSIMKDRQDARRYRADCEDR